MRHQTRHLIPCLCCFVLFAGQLHIAHAQKLQVLDARYDTAWLPITESQLKKGIAAAGSSPVTMWQLMRRAVASGQGDALYRVLKPFGEQELKANNIKHPVFVAAYADAITRTDLATPAEREQARHWIDKAVATGTDQWFSLLVRAEAERYDDPERLSS